MPILPAMPRRVVALGGAATLLAVIAVVEVGQPAEAGEPLLPGVALPAPAVDVSVSDSDLGSVAREVVVLVEGDSGPRLVKLRARNQSQADRLAEHIDAQPGFSAEVNRVVQVPSSTAVAGRPRASAKPAGRVELRSGSGGRTALGLPALAGEQFGAYQWGLPAVGAEAAWQVTRGGGTVVAVIDTGVDHTHPDLAGRVLPQIDLVEDSWTGDPQGHGTHVAGIIAASLDGAGVAGLANKVSILPVRVLDETGTGDFFTEAKGIIAAVDAGATVINLSLGGPYSEIEDQAVQYAVDSGVTVVSAVGNEYESGNARSYPAALPGVIGVSSIDQDGYSSWFANTGDYVDISAPGEQILSTLPGGEWDFGTGTSMAAPFVAATAALVRAANPRFTKAQVDSALLSTAADDADGDGWDTWFGYGLVQADRAALTAATAPYGLRAPAVKAQVKPVNSRSKLFVDVDPNKGAGFWRFQVQKKRADGTWRAVKKYSTQGARETRTIDLPKGVYRVKVYAKYGYKSSKSSAVRLKR